MPELPEVEKAVGVIRDVAVGKRIDKVETAEDDIVFSGVAHEEFAREITGRKVIDVGRYGKCFYLTLSRHGRMPVLHFGMTGMLQVKGELATYYKSIPKSATTSWPPRFYKFILHLIDETTKEISQLAFLDARRLGRVRLRASPLTEPPISELGFDPILSMPTQDYFSSAVLKRSCPVKALLLDQSFSAGVGNWVADEILYNARIHPEQKCNTLPQEQVTALYQQICEVCRIAVAVNADDSKFPDHWIFKHRWGKGKGKKAQTLRLPSGETATIKWITVGGRTSAFVEELQVLPENPPDVAERRISRKRNEKGKRKVNLDDDHSKEESVSSLSSDSGLASVTGAKRLKLVGGSPKDRVASQALEESKYFIKH